MNQTIKRIAGAIKQWLGPRKREKWTKVEVKPEPVHIDYPDDEPEDRHPNRATTKGAFGHRIGGQSQFGKGIAGYQE